MNPALQQQIFPPLLFFFFFWKVHKPCKSETHKHPSLPNILMLLQHNADKTDKVANFGKICKGEDRMREKGGEVGRSGGGGCSEKGVGGVNERCRQEMWVALQGQGGGGGLKKGKWWWGRRREGFVGSSNAKTWKPNASHTKCHHHKMRRSWHIPQ